MDPTLRRRLLGRDVRVERGILTGFRRRKNRHFYITREARAFVEGLLLFELSNQDLIRLDQYEEVPHLYTREKLTVSSSSNHRYLAWVYLPTQRLLSFSA